MLPGQCSICLGHKEDDAIRAAALGTDTIIRNPVPGPWRPHGRTASHNSRCPRCHEWIVPGDLIYKDAGAEWWVCADCVGQEL
jgi:hypothetical protein